MRVALVSPLLEAVPPRTYGGTERVVATLANTLSELGHEVTVFATRDSRVNAQLVGCRDRAMLTDEREHAMAPDHLLMLNKVRQRAEDFDIIHFHTEFLHFPMFHDLAWKTLTTCHSRLDLVNLPTFFQTYSQFPGVVARVIRWVERALTGTSGHATNSNTGRPSSVILFRM